MERPEWVPLVRVLSLPCIIDFKISPPLRRPISGRFIPQRRVPKNSLSGSHWFEWLSSPCLINLKIDSPPTTHPKSTSLLSGWVGGRIFLF